MTREPPVPGAASETRSVHVVRDFHAQYTDPIAVEAGDPVRVGREDDEFPGWWWCTAPDGRAGWVPGEILEPAPAPGATVRARAAYTARELTVRQGEVLLVHEERGGWLFVRNQSGAAGWVPVAHTSPAGSATPGA